MEESLFLMKIDEGKRISYLGKVPPRILSRKSETKPLRSLVAVEKQSTLFCFSFYSFIP
jgi:hypothetical protein